MLSFLPAFCPMPGGMRGGTCGDPKGGNTGQWIRTLLFPAYHLWDGKSRMSACSTMLCFMLRNKPVPAGWGSTAAPFCLQEESSNVMGRAVGWEGVSRGTLNRVLHFRAEGRRFLLLLGQPRTHAGASKSHGVLEEMCERLQTCRGTAGACQWTGRNCAGAPRSDAHLGHSCSTEVPKKGREMFEQGRWE